MTFTTYVSQYEVFEKNRYQPYTEKVKGISEQKFLDFEYSELTDSGYVIESLESALWCFVRTDTFEEAILMSANIGNDADTTAAVCGQIAGAFYGESKMPIKWVNKLAMLDEISTLADDLYELGKK